MKVNIHGLIKKCFIARRGSIRDLEFWLEGSPDHFYVSKKTTARSSKSLHHLTVDDTPLCRECMTEKLREMDDLYEFKQQFTPFKAFDPFAGVGAFVRGLECAGAVEFTHAIEICPSAALTLKYVHFRVLYCG